MSGLVIEPAASQDAPLGERSTGFVKTAVRLVRNLHMIAREFDNPLRSILIGLTANSIDVDLERLRLLKPFDQRFRNQCLALLMGTPGFDVHKAVELMPHEEPLRTQALALLVAAGSVDAERLVRFAQFRPEVPGHTDVFLKDRFDRVFADEVHLRAAVEWLLHSQAVTGTGGFAAAYSFKDGWLPPYPETTGYIIPTLWDASAVLGDERLRAAALAAAEWELAIQLPSGGIQAGYWGADPQRFWSAESGPAAFNTGQVVLGWNRAYQETGERRFLEASVRGCRFLAECVDEAGIFRRGLSPGPTNPTRAYYTRVAYALAWTGRLTGEARFEAVARRHLDWVVQQQDADGWFRHAGFQDDEMPLTHTMAYTAEGLLAAGELLEEERYVAASARHVVAAAAACERRGLLLPARFAAGWKAVDEFCCVPGNAQFAWLWCRHGRRTGDVALINTGLKMVDWLKQRQALDNVEAGIRGGLPGAWPIDGGYSIYSYVNWAAKYFADALVEARVAREWLDDAR